MSSAGPRSRPTPSCTSGVSPRAVAVLDVEGGRTIARSGAPEIARSMTEVDWIGRDVHVVTPGAFEAG